MAGLGIGPAEFGLFEIPDPAERADALEATLQPKLEAIAAELVAGLSRITGRDLFIHAPRVVRRKAVPPEELPAFFADNPKNLRGLPALALVATRAHLHARVVVRGESPRVEPMRGALRREAGNLARKGKPFRKLRPYEGWDHEELPEIAPAQSPAFWEEISEGLASRGDGLDVGIAWTAEEARSLAVGDVLGVFRDLAPLYKVLVNAG